MSARRTAGGSNPALLFEPAASIRCTVPRASHVTIRVYSLSGGLVRTLLDRSMEAGTWEVTWTGTNDVGNPVASGIYFYRLSVNKVAISKKMILLRQRIWLRIIILARTMRGQS